MLTISKLIKIQQNIAQKVILKDDFNKIKYIGGADVAFDDNYAYSAVVILDFKDLSVVDYAVAQCRITLPYIPTLLSFREVKPIKKAYQKLRIKPDIILCDGQGIAHPQKAGLAVFLGVILDIPSIGVAKTKLWGTAREPNTNKGSYSFLFHIGKRIGIVLRTQTKVKPLFISPGHKITIATAKKVVMRCVKKFRIPEPLRLAHIASKMYKDKNYAQFKSFLRDYSDNK